jgi:peptidoglycan/xylan/chitin deacetylase (PgdA/CDA1 family)
VAATQAMSARHVAPRRRTCTAAALVLLALAGAVAGCGSSSSSSGSTPGQPNAAGGTHHGLVLLPGPRNVARLAVPAHVPPRTVRVPILTYHRVHAFATELTKSIPDLTIEPSVFVSEIRALAQNGYHSITQAQLFGALFEGKALPSKPVLITVDDGYVDDIKTILPVLKRYHMVATFYIITGRFHEPGFLNATEVRELDDAGMDIGAHSRTHVPLNVLSASQMVDQIAGSRRDLQRVLGHFVYFFAYPYGAYDSAVVSEVRRAGFLLAVTTNGGVRASSQAPLTMPRIHVGRSATAASVLACVSAANGCGGGGGG